VNDWVDAEDHVERAHEHYEAGRWDEAESELRHALALNPYQPEWHFNLGLTLEAAGRHRQAVEAFRRCHELRDDDGQSALAVGMNLVRDGRVADALVWFDRAEKLDPQSATPLVHKIDAWTELGEHEQAEVAFFMGQQIDPGHGELYAAMAESLLARRDFDRAIWCLREASRLNPGLPRINARLAQAYAETGRQERARQLYQRELREDPGDIETLLDLGDLLVDMNRLDEASEKYRRILEIEPDHPDAHYALGEVAVRLGRAGDACVQFDIVVRLDPDHPEARRRLADLLLSSESESQTRRARELLMHDLRREMGLAKPDHATLEELGQLLLDADLPREAARVFARLLQMRPGDHLAHHHMSVALLETSQLDLGIDEAKSALRLNPRFVPAMHNLALAHLRRGEWLRARYWARQGYAIDPDDVSLRRLRLMLRVHSVGLLCRWLGRVAIAGACRLGRLVGRPRRATRTSIGV
jgi:tetratricopeptide (TPR) repeat protein